MGQERNFFTDWRSYEELVGSIVADHCDGDVTIPLGMILSEKELAVKG